MSKLVTGKRTIEEKICDFSKSASRKRLSLEFARNPKEEEHQRVYIVAKNSAFFNSIIFVLILICYIILMYSVLNNQQEINKYTDVSVYEFVIGVTFIMLFVIYITTKSILQFIKIKEIDYVVIPCYIKNKPYHYNSHFRGHVYRAEVTHKKGEFFDGLIRISSEMHSEYMENIKHNNKTNILIIFNNVEMFSLSAK